MEFKIPIYRCSPEQYENEKNKNLEEHLQIYKKNISVESWEQKYKKGYTNDFYIEKYVPWEFNEIIGYIIISISNTKVIFDLTLVKQRVSKTLKNKIFLPRGKIKELFFRSCDSTEYIFNEILVALKEVIMTDKRIKKYYTDLDDFLSFIPFKI